MALRVTTGKRNPSKWSEAGTGIFAATDQAITREGNQTETERFEMAFRYALNGYAKITFPSKDAWAFAMTGRNAAEKEAIGLGA